MELRIGDTARGFRYPTRTNSAGLYYSDGVDRYAGKRGKITTICPQLGYFIITFDTPFSEDEDDQDFYHYPIEEYMNMLRRENREKRLDELGINN